MAVACEVAAILATCFPGLFPAEPRERILDTDVDKALGNVGVGERGVLDAVRPGGDVCTLDIFRSREQGRDFAVMGLTRLLALREDPQQRRRHHAGRGGRDQMPIHRVEDRIKLLIDRVPHRSSTFVARGEVQIGDQRFERSPRLSLSEEIPEITSNVRESARPAGRGFHVNLGFGDDAAAYRKGEIPRVSPEGLGRGITQRREIEKKLAVRHRDELELREELILHADAHVHALHSDVDRPDGERVRERRAHTGEHLADVAAGVDVARIDRPW